MTITVGLGSLGARWPGWRRAPSPSTCARRRSAARSGAAERGCRSSHFSRSPRDLFAVHGFPDQFGQGVQRDLSQSLSLIPPCRLILVLPLVCSDFGDAQSLLVVGAGTDSSASILDARQPRRQVLGQRRGDRSGPVGDAHRCLGAAQRVLGEHVVLAAAQQQSVVGWSSGWASRSSTAARNMPSRPRNPGSNRTALSSMMTCGAPGHAQLMHPLPGRGRRTICRPSTRANAPRLCAAAERLGRPVGTRSLVPTDPDSPERSPAPSAGRVPLRSYGRVIVGAGAGGFGGVVGRGRSRWAG